jgi:hypothetical protein
MVGLQLPPTRVGSGRIWPDVKTFVGYGTARCPSRVVVAAASHEPRGAVAIP